MTRVRILLGRSLAALSLSLLGAPALAAVPAALDYQAPAGCPDAASFVLAVETRGASFAPGAASAAGERRLQVRIEPADSGFSGSLVVQSETEASEPRRVLGATCAEVSDALAVVTAIALQRDEQAPPPSTNATVPAAARTPSAPAAATPPAAEAAPEGPIPVVMGGLELELPPGKLVLDPHIRHTLSAGVQLGVIPGVVLPRLDFDISRQNVLRTNDGRAFMLGSDFRVRWTLLGLTHHRTPDYETALFGLKAGIGACTPLTYNPSGLIIKACSEFTVGVMGLTTRATRGGFRREYSQGLATAGFEADVQYNFSRLFHLDLRAGGELWAARISAEREDGSRLFQSPMFNAHVLVGLGIHF